MKQCKNCLVRNVSCLEPLSDDELSSIDACKRIYIIKKGETIFEEGSFSHGIYCFQRGLCKISILSSNKKSQIIKLIKPGEILGQVLLGEQGLHHSKATALENMEVCFIPNEEIFKLFNNKQKFAIKILKSVIKNLNDANAHLVSITQLTVKAQLAKTLVYLEDEFGVNKDNSLRINLYRKDIAELIGSSIENCIRLLAEFNQNKLIKICKRKIYLIDKHKLKSLYELS